MIAGWTGDIPAASDANALHAPPLAQREAAQRELATLPSRWARCKPVDLRREALDRLMDRIKLSNGGAHVNYAVKDDEPPASSPSTLRPA